VLKDTLTTRHYLVDLAMDWSGWTVVVLGWGLLALTWFC